MQKSMLTVLPAPIGPIPLCFCGKIEKEKTIRRIPDEKKRNLHKEGVKNHKFGRGELRNLRRELEGLMKVLLGDRFRIGESAITIFGRRWRNEEVENVREEKEEW